MDSYGRRIRLSLVWNGFERRFSSVDKEPESFVNLFGCCCSGDEWCLKWVRLKGFSRVFFESETVDSNNVLIVSGGRSNGVQCLRFCVFKSVTNQLLEPSS